MLLLHLAATKQIPATLSLTSDTGSELDRVCSDGTRMTSRQFFDLHVSPYAETHGIEAVFVRSRYENNEELPPIDDVLRNSSSIGKAGGSFDQMVKGLHVPLFTNDRSKGRLLQSCTDKWKIRAIHQEARRRGVTLLRSAIGFHFGEVDRVKSTFLRNEAGWDIWKPSIRRKNRKTGVVVSKEVRWLEHYHPLIDLKLNREDIRAKLKEIGLPYLVTTECDRCPHQDYKRWMMHTPESLDETAAIEAGWGGKLFFTSKRIPLKQALEQMRVEQMARQAQPSLFPCESAAYCGVDLL